MSISLNNELEYDEQNHVLKEMQAEVYAVNIRNGWFDTDRTLGDDIALLHSEVSEMLEAFRQHGTEDATRMTMTDTRPKPEGIGSEAADVLVRLLDTCERWEIDITHEFNRKLDYNRTRGYKHGGKKL